MLPCCRTLSRPRGSCLFSFFVIVRCLQYSSLLLLVGCRTALLLPEPFCFLSAGRVRGMEKKRKRRPSTLEYVGLFCNCRPLALRSVISGQGITTWKAH